MIHYQDTIKNRVSQERIFKYVDNNLKRRLQDIFGNRPIAVWGSQDGPQNRSRFEKMTPGDDVLIVEGGTIKLLGKVAATTISEDLSQELWKSVDGGRSEQPWKLIYFIANPVEIELSFTEFKKLFNYSPDWSLRGFTNVSDEKLETFYNEYDDLYSVLLRLKQGEQVEAKEEPELKIEEELIEVDEGIEEKMDEEEVSDHVRMQWQLLKLGLKTGSKVWVPRNDQSKIRKSYDYEGFESEFSAGIDTSGKYVENIDVVWKEEFRIDAAFEIENSTSIYSGLLRFADLKLVAPNSNYPLFIVAPRNRKAKVFAQVKRPTFKRLEFEKKVRYLSYEAVDEVDGFFKASTTGLNVDVLFGKSEEIR